ncbi:MAG: hypothetical protein RSD79_05830 [Cetobacterium sp.]
MKNCYTCKHKKIESEYGFIYCDIDVPNDVFELDCEHAECPSWEGEE